MKTIRKQQPAKIIVAVSAITPGAAHEIAKEAEALIFIHIISEDSIKNTYDDSDRTNFEQEPELIS